MKILMVCLGNICRSPLAHGIMQKLSDDNNLHWEIDSAGTSGWHNGNAPDSRSIKVAKDNGIDISRQSSRIITKADLDYYDLIFAMDKSNYKNILKLCSSSSQEDRVQLFLPFAGITERDEVPDPYYDGGFDYVYDLVYRACEGILVKVG